MTKARGLKVQRDERALISAGLQGKRATERAQGEGAFVSLVCDGMGQTEAFHRAGLKGDTTAAHRLWLQPHIQRAAAEILDARRRNGGAVTLPEVTDMLKRVFAAAYHLEELPTAHNAAFSLARLHGLVIDRAQITDLRRPSRDPDAPAEIALDDWVKALPSPVPPGPEGPGLEGPKPLILQGNSGPGGPQFENGAPSDPVTGTPTERAHSMPTRQDGPEVFMQIDSATKDLDPGLPPAKKRKKGPKKKKGTRVPRGERGKTGKAGKGSKNTDPKKPKFPSAKELFG